MRASLIQPHIETITEPRDLFQLKYEGERGVIVKYIFAVIQFFIAFEFPPPASASFSKGPTWCPLVSDIQIQVATSTENYVSSGINWFTFSTVASETWKAWMTSFGPTVSFDGQNASCKIFQWPTFSCKIFVCQQFFLQNFTQFFLQNILMAKVLPATTRVTWVRVVLIRGGNCFKELK